MPGTSIPIDDRAAAGQRAVELHEPGVEVIEALLVKTATPRSSWLRPPHCPDAWVDAAELEWISRDRECRQLVAWFGQLTEHAGRRRATVLGNGTVPPRTIVGVAQEEPPAVGRVGRYLCEPDAAVLAAGLAATLAAEHRLLPIAPGVAYWTADEPVDDRALGCFEVGDVMPLDVKRLKAHLRGRGIGRLEIKKRGVDCQPEQLRRQLTLRGESAATLIVLPIGGRTTAIVCRRMERQ